MITTTIETCANVIDYNSILTSSNVTSISDSVKAAKYDGNDSITIDSDRMVSIWMDTLTTEQYASADWEKAEEILFNYADMLMK